MDWILSDELLNTANNIVKLISEVAMIIGGVIPYIPQYRQIQRTQDSEGFSLYVCLTLLVANILRIFFWFGKRFEYPLLAQSIIMNITMLIMIDLCVRVRNKNKLGQPRARSFTDWNRKHFWAWTDFQSYLDCIAVFAIACAVLTYLLIDVPTYVELIGFISLSTEAMLGLPQYLKNRRARSTVGMSVSMVLMWTCGDVFKTVYALVRGAPDQFWICGAIQVGIDLAIMLQVRWYRKRDADSDFRRPVSVHRTD